MKNSEMKTLFGFRLLMWLLIAFEFLNWVNVLHFTLDFSWHWLLITDLLIWIITEIVIKNKKGINLNLVLPIIALSTYLDVSGDMFHLYSKVHNYDKFLHFWISALIAYVIYETLKDKLYKEHYNKALSSIIIISIASLFWMLYEIEEYLEDLLINKKILRMWDSFDTGLDLLMDLLGGIFIVMILLVLHRKKRKL